MSYLKSNLSSDVYFKSFNELRFIAAFAVVVHHIERNNWIAGIPSLYDGVFKFFIDHIGGRGVGFFFVLSGFLITYLLLKEKDLSGTIHIKEFYLRRVLRIWPLYFFLIGFSFIIIPLLPHFFDLPEIYLSRIHRFERSYKILLLLYIFMLPNVALKLFAPVPVSSHLWSIGVEEQFYLIWPYLVKTFLKKIISALLIILALKSIIQLILALILSNGHFLSNSYLNLTYELIKFFKIENMVIGALGATIIFYDIKKIKSFIFNTYVQIFNLLVLITLLFVDLNAPWVYFIIEPITFLILMLNISLNENSLLKIENKALSQLGKISYGIYMLHPLIKYFVVLFIFKFPILSSTPLYYQLTIYILTISGTLILSTISYKYFELPFVKLKKKYEYVKTS